MNKERMLNFTGEELECAFDNGEDMRMYFDLSKAVCYNKKHVNDNRKIVKNMKPKTQEKA